MDISVIAVIQLDEVIAEFQDHLRLEINRPDLAEALVAPFLAAEFEYLAKVAVHRNHINVHEYLARTRGIFTSYSQELTELAEDLADEMYILMRDEVSDELARQKHVYSVTRENWTLHIRLLAAHTISGYGIDPRTLIEQVI